MKMKTFTRCDDIPAHAKGAVIAIGNFDGVHRGHQALLAQARDIAKAAGKPFGVLTFEPHPRHLFRPDDPSFRLTTPDLKAERLELCDVDFLYALPFDWDFASLTAEQFITKILKEALGASHVVIGYDFCFGQLRKGTPATILDSGLPVTIVEKISDQSAEAFSSSAIRKSLRLGDLDRANELLGWPWELRGVVQVGDRRGRELGFPTANMRLGSLLHPAYGIYATWLKVVEDDGSESAWLPSATNIGIRPMFALSEGQVEAHIFDFARDIYGKTIRVRPVKRLRGEAKFDSLEALIDQMNRDCAEARVILGQNPA